jgi:hypothetical protein
MRPSQPELPEDGHEQFRSESFDLLEIGHHRRSDSQLFSLIAQTPIDPALKSTARSPG